MSESIDGDGLRPALLRMAKSLTGYQIASQIVSLVLLAVLYRLLDPTVFGLFAMVLPAVMFMRMLASGGLHISATREQSLSTNDQSGLLWISVLFGVAGMGLLAALSPIVAWFYAEPTLVAITLAMCGTVVLASLCGLLQAFLDRKLLVDRAAKLRLLAQTAGSIAAIGAASRGLGVWSLVVQHYVELIILTALLWHAVKLRPTWPRHDFNVRRHLHFGGHFTGSSVMFWIAQNADTFLIGRLGGPHVLGLYSQAYNLMIKPVLLVTTPVTALMLPALSRTLAVPDEYRRLGRTFFGFVGLVLFPCGVGLFVVADDLMLVLGGEKWRAAGPLFQALAPVILVQGFINIAGSVFASAGRADRLFKASTVATVALCFGITAGWWLGFLFGSDEFGGALGVAVGLSLVSLVVVVPYLRYCLATVDMRLADVIAVVQRPLIAALAMGAAVWFVRLVFVSYELRPGLRLLMAVLEGVVIYGLLLIRYVLAGPTAGKPAR